MRIDWDDLELAFDGMDLEGRFLDRQTGEVLVWSSHTDDPEHIEELSDRIDSEPDRYVRIQPVETRTQWEWMAEFIEAVKKPDLRRALEDAIAGRGAFSRFKRVLEGHPAERERWFAYRDARLREEIQRWLDANGLEAGPDDAGAAS